MTSTKLLTFSWIRSIHFPRGAVIVWYVLNTKTKANVTSSHLRHFCKHAILTCGVSRFKNLTFVLSSHGYKLILCNNNSVEDKCDLISYKVLHKYKNEKKYPWNFIYNRLWAVETMCQYLRQWMPYSGRKKNLTFCFRHMHFILCWTSFFVKFFFILVY